MNRRKFLATATLGPTASSLLTATSNGCGNTTNSDQNQAETNVGKTANQPVHLSPDHIAAVNRRRRVVKNFDVILIAPETYPNIEALLKNRFDFIDDPLSTVESVWWNWGEGNVVPYPSKFLPKYTQPGYKKWLDDGVDIVRIFQDATRRRGLEVFFSHRMNGSDNDPQYTPKRGSFVDNEDLPNVIPLKQEHPDWLIRPIGKIPIFGITP